MAKTEFIRALAAALALHLALGQRKRGGLPTAGKSAGSRLGDLPLAAGAPPHHGFSFRTRLLPQGRGLDGGAPRLQRLLFSCAGLRAVLRCRNLLTGETEDAVLRLSVGGRGSQQLQYTLRPAAAAS